MISLPVRWLLLAAAAGLSPAAAAERTDAGLYLFQIAAERASATWKADTDRVEVDLQGSDPDRLAALLEASTDLEINRISRTLRLSLTKQATLSTPPTNRHGGPSFVVDYTQPSVQSLVEALTGEFGPEPSTDQLIRFTNAHIPTKSYRQGFDIASRVAVTGEGDCTEHAVLLTALARATGKPARILFGLLLVQQNHRFFAFGHAWSEILEPDGWVIADATRVEADFSQAVIRYLPLMELGNEGPGYTMDIMRLNTLMPARVQQVETIREGPNLTRIDARQANRK